LRRIFFSKIRSPQKKRYTLFLGQTPPFPPQKKSASAAKPILACLYKTLTLMVFNLINLPNLMGAVAVAVNSHQRICGFLQERVVKHPSVEYWLCKDDGQAPTMASDWLFFITQAAIELQSQMKIDPHQVCMANAAMAHFGLDPGRFVRWMGGEYTGQHWDAHSTLAVVRDNVLADDYTHMKRILLDGCPVQLNFEEPLSNKIKLIECGISKSSTITPIWS
jgi:hypothetical protein